METTIAPVKYATTVGLPRMSKRRAAFVFAATGVLSMSVAILMSVVGVLTLFQSRRFCSEVLARWLGRSILRVCGIRMEVGGARPPADQQTVYLTNHTSYDRRLRPARAWPASYALLPVGRTTHVSAGGCNRVSHRRLLHTDAIASGQACPLFPARRRVLRRSGDSVVLSPEGMCVTTGVLGRFNKGAFHLATNLRAPIVPIFISIPRHINPGRGYGALPGTVQVHFKEPVSTREWSLDDLERNKESVRDRYIAWNRELQRL